MIGGWADEAQPVLLDDGGELVVLRKEAVTGMNGVRVGDHRRRDDRRNVEIALPRRGRSDADALVGEPDMHRVLVRRRVHRDGPDAHFLAGAVDPERDLSPIGDKDLVEHAQDAYSRIISASPYSTGAASETRTRTTLPARGERTGLKVFIASIRTSVSPSSTVSPACTKGGAPGSGDK